MDSILFPAMTSSILTLFLGVFFLIIYTKRKNEKEYLYFSIICFASFILSIGNYLSINSSDFQESLFWERFMHIGAAILIPTSFHFALIYTKTKKDLLLKCLYGIGFCVLCICFTNLFIQNIPNDSSDFTKGGIRGPLYPLYALTILLVFLYTIYILWNRYIKSVDKEDRRLILPILIGGILYIICGLTETAMAIKLLSCSTITDYGPGIFCIFVTYSLIDKFALTCEHLDASMKTLKQIQEKLVRSERLSAIGEMASKVVHEMKNPLAGIRFLTELCQRDLPENDQKVKYGKEILGEINRLNKFLSQFLNLAKPIQLNLRPIEIESFIDNLLFILPEIKEKHIKVEKSVTPEIVPIHIDPDQMKQVFLNLILNGIQAMQDNGVLKIRIEKLSLPESVLVEISDIGEGIEEGDLPKIFDPFFTTKAEGTGLGLAITQKIIDSHGGSIRVKSKKGEGSTFIIQIPCVKEENQRWVR